MLKGSYTKYFKFQSLVTVDDLYRIYRYLHSRCGKVIYNFETSDGANYDADVIEDIIGYSNPSNAKIEKVTMIAQNNGKYSAHNHIIVKFYNRGRWDSSASLYISDANSDEIAAISKDLGIIIEQTKTDYSWMYSRWFLLFLNMLLTTIVTVLLYVYIVPFIKENNASWWIQTSLLQMIILIPLFLGFVRSIEWAYPETVFNIGAQKSYYNKLLNRRKAVLGSISTIILGVISSILVTKFF